MKTGALILASADYGRELLERGEAPVFFPMHVLDGVTVIKREIAVLRRAAVSPILVLTGHEGEALKSHLVHHQVLCVENSDYRRQEWEETLLAGLLEAEKHMDRILVIPAEYPAFSKELVLELLSCKKPAVPVYEGKEGWPRLYVPGREREEVERIPVEDAGCVLSLLEENGLLRAEAYMRRQRESNALGFRFRLVLEKENEFFGPGVYEFLKQVDAAGSIQAAAARMNMSYSKGWKMVNQAEKEMGFLFLERNKGGKNGGSSMITEEGRLFLEQYHEMEKALKQAGQKFFEQYFREYL
ncbi:MAG: NTP transferase domain-containing protein [Lachnospiraceae bacterium]|jgi:molybdate transport repressor ModE-like protein|nr:NTP transferase domain-containing protein [Lachnospiraceae bacterium]